MQKFYLTTTLPYVNDYPHVGHTLEFIQADVICRYKREKLGADNVFFNLGTDEHGLKIFEKAKTEGIDTKAFVDKYVTGWLEFCKLYGIQYDNFYRTSDQKHNELAQKLWNKLLQDGQLYKKQYKGLYCVGCESFKTEKELVEGKCPDHGKEPIVMEEENYFLKLSAQGDKILEYISKNPEFVKNSDKLKHLTNFLKEGLQDISVSRTKSKLPWGIEIPNDSEQVMYVWLDALSNYIFAVGYMQDDERFNQFWPCVQLCGPDNLKFQGAIWQGILGCLGLPFSKQILVHGMVQAEDGRKMSKTLGNVISPFDILEKYGLEAVRYYFTLGIATYDDSSFSTLRLEELYNDGLADKYGNLLNRVIHLANKNGIRLFENQVFDDELKAKIDERLENYRNFMDEFELSLAFNEIYTLTKEGNEYISVKQPWLKDRTEEDKKRTLFTLGYLLKNVIDCYAPILIESTAKAKSALEAQTPIVLFTKDNIKNEITKH